MDEQTKELSIGEVAIHLSYIRKSVEEVKENQKKNNEDIHMQFKELKDGYTPRSEFLEHVKDVADFKVRLSLMETKTEDIGIIRKLVYGCAGLILTSVVVSLIYLVVSK